MQLVGAEPALGRLVVKAMGGGQHMALAHQNTTAKTPAGHVEPANRAPRILKSVDRERLPSRHRPNRANENQERQQGEAEDGAGDAVGGAPHPRAPLPGATGPWTLGLFLRTPIHPQWFPSAEFGWGF